MLLILWFVPLSGGLLQWVMSVVCWLAKPKVILRPVILTGLPKMSSPTCAVVTGLVPSVVLLLWALIGHGSRRGGRPGHYNKFITILWMLAGEGEGRTGERWREEEGKGGGGRERGKGELPKYTQVNKTVNFTAAYLFMSSCTSYNIIECQSSLSTKFCTCNLFKQL